MKTLIIALIFLFILELVQYSQSNEPKDALVVLSSDEIFSKCSDAVVMLFCYDQDNILIGYGSGVIVSTDGLVYTNFHVIRDAKRIEIRNDEKSFDSIPVVGFNGFYDVAVLKLPDGFYSYIKVSENMDVIIGKEVFALGNPKGYTKTISKGIISAVRENNDYNKLQISVPISPGSSGGALLDSYGELIGITSAGIKEEQLLNFAIPVRLFNNLKVIDIKDSLQSEILEKMFSLNIEDSDLHEDGYEDVIYKYTELLVNDSARWEFAGRSYYLEDEIDSALYYFSKAIEICPDNYKLYLWRAECYGELSDTLNALKDYSTSLCLNDKYLDTYESRARYYQYNLKNYELAIDDYRKILKINPEYDFYYSFLADCKVSMGDEQGAVQELSRGLLWKSDASYLYNFRAALYSKLKLYDQAISDYTASLSITPLQADVYLSRAVNYSKLNKDDMAIIDYLEYLKYRPREAVALNNLGYCYMEIGDFEEAEKYFKKALYNDPKHMDSYIGLSILNYRNNGIKATVENMSKAIEINGYLMFGMNGVEKLEETGWFWDKEEKEIMKQIFNIMSIVDSKIDSDFESYERNRKHKGKRPSRVKADRSD